MGQCSHCKSPFTCSCQIRVASDGTKLCASCVPIYEQLLQNNINTQ
jgi:hypothetical protein